MRAAAPGTQRQNSFDLLRLVGATAVLVSHSFALTARVEPHVGPITLGTAGVLMFFGVSGFLITQSWLHEPRLFVFLGKRALRILPALAAVLSIVALVIGPIITALTTGEYLTSQSTWRYIGANLAMVPHFALPGVFDDAPAFAGIANGSIWTLTHEVHAYFVVALLGLCAILTRRRIALAALVVVVVAANAFPNGVHGIGDPKFMAAFGCGAALYLWRDRVVWNGYLAAAFVAAAGLLAALTTFGEEAWALAIPYATIFLAYRFPHAGRAITRHGDFSYGLYLWAWPLQMLVVLAWPAATPVGLIALALPCALTAGVLSWHLVEKRALRAKRFLRTAPAKPAPAGPVAPEAAV